MSIPIHPVPSEVDRRIGSRVAVRRIALGMTQDQLALSLGLTEEQLDGLERGESRFAPGMIIDLCGILNVQPSTFFV